MSKLRKIIEYDGDKLYPVDLVWWLDNDFVKREDVIKILRNKEKYLVKFAIHKPTKLKVFDSESIKKAFSNDKGDFRPITAPNKTWKLLLEKVLTVLEIFTQDHKTSKGFRTKHSIYDNAIVHKGKKHKFLIDIKDAFGGILYSEVFRIFKELGVKTKTAHTLTRFVTLRGKVPQGFTTSPKLLNLAMYKLDCRISKLCEKLGLVYSRYADDITISSDTKISQKLINTIIGIIKSERWTIAPQKMQLTSANWWVTTGVLTDGFRTMGKVKNRKTARTLDRARCRGATHTRQVNQSKERGTYHKCISAVVLGNYAYDTMARNGGKGKPWKQTKFAIRLDKLITDVLQCKEMDSFFWSTLIDPRKTKSVSITWWGFIGNLTGRRKLFANNF